MTLTQTSSTTALQERLTAAQAAFNALPENGAGDAYTDLLDEIFWLKEKLGLIPCRQRRRTNT